MIPIGLEPDLCPYTRKECTIFRVCGFIPGSYKLCSDYLGNLKEQSKKEAKLRVHAYCPSCGMLMQHATGCQNYPGAMYCTEVFCPEKGIQYRIPTIELELYNE